MKFPSATHKIRLANDSYNIFLTLVRKDGQLHFIFWHSRKLDDARRDRLDKYIGFLNDWISAIEKVGGCDNIGRIISQESTYTRTPDPCRIFRDGGLELVGSIEEAVAAVIAEDNKEER